MFNRTLIGTVVVGVLFATVLPMASYALSITDVQTQLQELLAKIQDLTKQINALQVSFGQGTSTESTSTIIMLSTSPVPAHRVCSVLYRNMVQGTRGDDVQGLQEFLSTEGYLLASPTGYFGPATAQAVAKWQTAEGISPIGSIGPLSRARIIKTRCDGEYDDVTRVCTKEYKPVCGLKQIVCIKAPCNPVPTTYNNICLLKTDGAAFSYEGECRTSVVDPANDPQCKSWYDGCNTCSRSQPDGPAACTLRACMEGSMVTPYCSSYFDDTVTTNKPPTISAFSGPTVLRVNEEGTWTIKASDPENGILSYDIAWGDERYAVPMAMNASALGKAFVQNTTFSHAYVQVGTYSISITVRDSAGYSARTSTTVKVTEETSVACTLEYAPVCGRPNGCANGGGASCPPGSMCPMYCLMPQPQTYSNTCFLKAAQADLIHEGACTAGDASPTPVPYSGSGY